MKIRNIFVAMALTVSLPLAAHAQIPSVNCRDWRDIVMAVQFSLEEYYYYLDNRGVKNSRKKADGIASGLGLPNGEAPHRLFSDARTCRYTVPEKPEAHNFGAPKGVFFGYQCDIVVEQEGPVDIAGLEQRAMALQEKILACSKEFKGLPGLVASDRGIEWETKVVNDQTLARLGVWSSGSVDYPKSAISALRTVAGYRLMPMEDAKFLLLVVYRVTYERARR